MQGQPKDIMLYNAKFYKDGKEYHFISAQRMTSGISAIEFLEFSSHQGSMFGTKLETVHQIHNQDKSVILDTEPQTLNIVQTVKRPAFMVFLKPTDQSWLTQTEAPPQLQKDSEQPICSCFDLSLVNNGVDKPLINYKKPLTRPAVLHSRCLSPRFAKLTDKENYCMPLCSIWNSILSALRQRRSPLQELCVSLQLYAIIVTRPVGVSFVQTPEALDSGFPDTWGSINQDFKRVSGNWGAEVLSKCNC